MAASRVRSARGTVQPCSPAPPLPLLCIDCLAKPGYSLRFKKGTPGLPTLEELQSQKRLRGTVRARFERRISCLASRHRWQMKTSGTLDLRILAQERWIQVAHSLHSIMGLPAKGFRQKQVIRSQASSSDQGERHRSETTLPAAGPAVTGLASSTSVKWDSPPTHLLLWCWALPRTQLLKLQKGGGAEREKNKDQMSKAALHLTSDTFQVCTAHSAEQSCQKAGQVPALCSSVPQVPKVLLPFAGRGLGHRQALPPAASMGGSS